MTAEERYEWACKKYLVRLNQDSKVRLTSFLREIHVYHRGMTRWMQARGLSVGEAKRQIRESQNRAKYERLLPSSDTTGSMFLPVTADGADGFAEAADPMSGISFTFPDVTQVNIKHGSAQSVMSFLKLYQMEGMPCLD